MQGFDDGGQEAILITVWPNTSEACCRSKPAVERKRRTACRKMREFKEEEKG
jgi:hypothetical protein